MGAGQPLWGSCLSFQGAWAGRGSALPVSAGMAILSCFPVGGKKGFFWKKGWKTTGPPLDMGKLRSDGAGIRKSTAGLNSEGRAASARPGVGTQRICGLGPVWTGHCGSQSPYLPPKSPSHTYRGSWLKALLQGNPSTTHSKGWVPTGQSVTFNPGAQGLPESFRQPWAHQNLTQRNLLALPGETLLEQRQQCPSLGHGRYRLGPSLGVPGPMPIALGNHPPFGLGCLSVAEGCLSELL